MEGYLLSEMLYIIFNYILFWIVIVFILQIHEVMF